MTDHPSIIEPYSGTPGLDDARLCIYKQLALDGLRLAEARKNDERARPPFPRLWVLGTGRAKTVIEAYGLEPMPGFPAGFWTRREADALGLVALRDVPPDRDTLLLRLMAGGDVLRDAIAELARLPEGAWEREVALPELIALRVEIPQDPRDDEEREFMMSTQSAYDEWRQRTLDEGSKKGEEKGARQALLAVYQSRFGQVPPEIAAAVGGMHDAATLQQWTVLAATSSRDTIAAAMRAEQAAS